MGIIDCNLLVERKCQMTQLVKSVAELEKYLKETYYIFGAGVVARAVITWIRGKEKQIKGVIVSKTNAETDILGFPVKNLSEVEDIGESVIIVALMEKSHNEIGSILQEAGVRQVLYISDTLYYQLECENGNYDINEIYLLNLIKQKIQKIENKIQEIDYRMREERIKYLWTNKTEREITKANWQGYYEKKNFADRFQSLVYGLDKDSIETVIRIVNRQKRYLLSKAEEIDLYTVKEKEELDQLYDNFYALIIELSPNLYMYDKYFLVHNHFEPSVFYYKHGVHKLNNLKRLEGGVFFDVGGFIGDSAIVFQELNPKQVYSFEALPQHCQEMRKNLKLNHISNVIIENMALGNEIKEVDMAICGSASNHINRGGITALGMVKVQMRTLDEYVSKHNIQECSLIKVDIEGGEPYFLEGARQTISTFKPVILLSIYHNEHDFFELKPLIESWNLGYKFQIYKPTNGNLTNETLLIAEVYG